MFKIFIFVFIFIISFPAVEDPVVVTWIKSASDPWRRDAKWEPLPPLIQNIQSVRPSPRVDGKGAFDIEELTKYIRDNRESNEVVGEILALLKKPDDFVQGEKIADRVWAYKAKVFKTRMNKSDPSDIIKEYGNLEIVWRSGDRSTGLPVYFPSVYFKEFE